MSELKPCPSCANPADAVMRWAYIADNGETYSEKINFCPKCGRPLTEKASRAQPANDKDEAVRPIDANTLLDEIKHLQIFLAGESLFTPAIKETVLRTIDEQSTVDPLKPANEPLTLEQLREMDEEYMPKKE